MPTYDHSKDAIAPHGGVLIDRFADAAARSEIEALAKTGNAPEIKLNPREVSDLEMIACGAFSPLKGFMNRADYERVRLGGAPGERAPLDDPRSRCPRGPSSRRSRSPARRSCFAPRLVRCWG